MNKKGKDDQFNVMVMFFILILIGLAFTQGVANSKSLQTDKQLIANETINIAAARLAGGEINPNTTFTVANHPTGWKVEDGQCSISSVVYGNASKSFTLNTDYVLNATYGNFTLRNTANTNSTGAGSNTTLINHDYCADGYLQSSGDRAMANLWTTFMILTLIIVGAGIVLKLWKDSQ